MSEHSSITSDLETWILKFLAKPSKSFGNLPPCPYARRAWLDGKVKIIDNYLSADYSKILSGEMDLYVLHLPYMDSNTIELYMEEILDHVGPDFIILDDHPDVPEEVDGVNLNFGKPLIFIQSRAKLTEAREQLKLTDYYNHFDSAYLASIYDC